MNRRGELDMLSGSLFFYEPTSACSGARYNTQHASRLFRIPVGGKGHRLPAHPGFARFCVFGRSASNRVALAVLGQWHTGCARRARGRPCAPWARRMRCRAVRFRTAPAVWRRWDFAVSACAAAAPATRWHRLVVPQCCWRHVQSRWVPWPCPQVSAAIIPESTPKQDGPERSLSFADLPCATMGHCCLSRCDGCINGQFEANRS